MIIAGQITQWATASTFKITIDNGRWTIDNEGKNSYGVLKN